MLFKAASISALYSAVVASLEVLIVSKRRFIFQ